MSSRLNQKQFVVGIEIYFNQFQVIIMSKRRHFGPSGNTPGKSRPKRSIHVSDHETGKPARKTLFASWTVDIACAQCNEEWTREELGALVEYVALYWDGAHTSGWPSTKNLCFWDDCATAIKQSTGQPKRTGKPRNTISFAHPNRPIKGICGLTRECVVGLIANLVTRELRRSENEGKGLPPEHPRASSTDDVEGIISLFHDVMGSNFDLKIIF